MTATGENSLGSETAMLYLHVTCEIPSFVKDVFVLFVSALSTFYQSLWNCCFLLVRHSILYLFTEHVPLP